MMLVLLIVPIIAGVESSRASKNLRVRPRAYIIDSNPIRKEKEMATWLTTVGFGGNPAPRGPWKSADAARESLRRWVRRQGADAASLIAAHTIRVHAYATREAARAGDISDGPGRNGCVSIRSLNDFLGGAL